MSAHVTTETLKRLERGELTQSEILETMAHLAGCAECRALLEARDPGPAVAAIQEVLDRDLREPRHLDPDTEIIPYVEGALDSDDRLVVESHIAGCRLCDSEVRDLLRLRPTRKPYWLAAGIAAAAACIAILVSRPGRDQPNAPVLEPPPARSVPAPVPPSTAARYERPEWESLVTSALSAGKFETPAVLATLRPSAEAMREVGDAAAVVLRPAGLVLDATRPEFSWPDVPGATYVVTVATIEAEKSVAVSPRLSRARWRCDRDLRRGQIYVWQVDALRGDEEVILPSPPAPPALFRIISQTERAELEAARSSHPGDALLMAALYARLGMDEQMRRELRHLAAKSPRGDLRRLVDTMLFSR